MKFIRTIALATSIWLSSLASAQTALDSIELKKRQEFFELFEQWDTEDDSYADKIKESIYQLSQDTAQKDTLEMNIQLSPDTLVSMQIYRSKLIAILQTADPIGEIEKQYIPKVKVRFVWKLPLEFQSFQMQDTVLHSPVKVKRVFNKEMNMKMSHFYSLIRQVICHLDGSEEDPQLNIKDHEIYLVEKE